MMVTNCHRGMLLSNTTILFSITTGGIKNPPVAFLNKILVFSNKILVFSIYFMKHLQDTWKIVTFAY